MMLPSLTRQAAGSWKAALIPKVYMVPSYALKEHCSKTRGSPQSPEDRAERDRGRSPSHLQDMQRMFRRRRQALKAERGRPCGPSRESPAESLIEKAPDAPDYK